MKKISILLTSKSSSFLWVIIILNMTVTVIRNKTLSVNKYLNKIRPYLKDIISDIIKSDT